MESAQAEACAEAERWCAAQLDAIGTEIRGAAALGPLMAALIDDWCETQRTLAFARREGQVMAMRDERHAAACAKWDALWMSFWQEVCDRLGLSDVATLTAWVFDGASSLHLLRWRRPVDRAGLSELCDGWANWVDGRVADPSPWFEMARRDALALILPSPPEDETAHAIAVAAAATVAQRGVTGLTHRAVAAEAGLTLGVVSYKFRTSADLLKAAFDAIYRRLAPQEGEAPRPSGSGLARPTLGRADLLGTEELSAAAARDPDLQAFAAQLRYLRGESSGRAMQRQLGPDIVMSPIENAIASALMGGRVRAYVAGGRAQDPDPVDGDFGPLLTRFARR
uniref:TetR/AcrR family transcriptional regulator n=1 Tax=uncultured Caulobacter sp. TaxID=158749 RepID=UPI0025E0CAAD|nr:TetR family transcriptional regulator [uncultured Caulobacter sp.]